jgi:hypothetical protein
MATEKLGTQTIDYLILGSERGSAEKIVREFAHDCSSERFSRSVGEWFYSKEFKSRARLVTIAHNNGSRTERTVLVFLDEPQLTAEQHKRALRLTDTHYLKGRFSLKKGHIKAHLSPNDIQAAVCILTAAICRGDGWQDSAGHRIDSAFGPMPTGSKPSKKRASGWRARRDRDRAAASL